MSEKEVTLIDQINEKRAQVQINALTYDMDWITHQIHAGDIVIDPEYQRLFQWTEEQESRFIESLILNLPIPPIYLVEEDDGKRILLDGLQRICTYLHFVGQMPEGFEVLIQKLNSLRKADESYSELSELEVEDIAASDEESAEVSTIVEEATLNSLRLTGCDIIEDLNGKTFDDLEPGIVRRLKRKPIDIYSYTSTDTWIQYQMFTRMNAGGSPLSPQQVRNAKIRIINTKIIDKINDLGRQEPFISLAKRFFGKSIIKNRKMELEEIVLRLLAFSNYSENYTKNINEFLDKFLEEFSAGRLALDIEQQAQNFIDTCNLLNEHLPVGRAFRINGKAYAGLFEAIFIEIFKHIGEIKPETLSDLQIHIDSLTEPEIFPFKGGGKNTKNYFQQRLTTARKLLNLHT